MNLIYKYYTWLLPYYIVTTLLYGYYVVAITACFATRYLQTQTNLTLLQYYVQTQT